MTLPGAPADGWGLRPRAPAAPLLASALLLALAHPPFRLLLPSFVALVPLAVWVERLPPGAEGRRDALLGGFLAGVATHGLLLHWMATGLAAHDPLLALPAFGAAVLVLSALLAAATAGVHAAVTRLRWPVWLALPVFWTAVEWLRAHMGDLSFPWLQLGDSLSGWPRLIGAADLVGGRGLSFWLALVSGLLAEAVLRWRPAALERWLPAAGRGAPPGGGRAGPAEDRRAAPGGKRGAAWRPLVIALLVSAVPIAYSLHRWNALELEPAAEVAVVQTDVPPGRGTGAPGLSRSARAAAARLPGGERGGDAPGIDLVVLPETVVPEALAPRPAPPAEPRAAAGEGGERERGRGPAGERDGRGEPPAWIDRLAARLDAPVLFGAPGLRPRPGREAPARFNEAFLRGPGGRWLGRYAKRRLVPGAETIPFVDGAALADRLPGPPGPGFGGFTAGPEPGLLPAGRARFGVLVCYESIFAELSRGHRGRGADFLVNVTNDAWFGRAEPAWMRTAAFWQHPAHLVTRAVETRTGIVRSANAGFSQLVDPLGRRTRGTGLFESAAFTGTVLTTPGRTLFVRWGDVVGLAAALAAGAAVLGAGLRGGRRAGAAE